MLTKIRTTLLFTFLFLNFFSNAQDIQRFEPQQNTLKDSISLSLTTYNHAELLFKGFWKYVFNDSTLSIIRESAILPYTSTVIFSKKIQINLSKEVQFLRLDTLKNFYFNRCVMGTSGNEYYVIISVGTSSKKIHLHHYYRKEIKKLTIFLNKLLPKIYKIDYLDLDTKQDCEW